MAVLKVAVNQVVAIPDVQVENGSTFTGRIKSSEGEVIVIEHDPQFKVKLQGRHREHLLTMTWDVGGEMRACPILIRHVAPTELSCQVVIEERRASIRARCDVQMYLTPIDPEDLNEMTEEVLSRVGRASESPPTFDPLVRTEIEDEALRTELNVIRAMVEKLTQQVDRLTEMVEEKDQGATHGREVRALDVVDCSATGIAFRHDRALRVGTFLKVRLVFQSIPKLTVECIAVVVRLQSRSGQNRHGDHFDMGLRFTHIHEADRDAIVRHIFKVQRNLLRDRKLSGR